MAYENYEMALINSFGMEVEEGIVIPENIDIQGNHARTKYNRYLTAMNGLIIEHERLKRQASKDVFARMHLASFEQQIPLFRTAKGISALKGYYTNMADGYGIGFLYSESLLAKYLDDAHAFQIQLDKLVDKEQSLQDLLTYYGINAKSNEVYDRVNTRLEEIRTFKKR